MKKQPRHFMKFHPRNETLTFFSNLFTSVILGVLYHKKEFVYTSVPNISYLKYLIFFCAGVSLMGSITASEIHQVKLGKYSGTTVQLKDSSIITTSSSFVFVGKTENYIFFYDIKNKRSEVISSSEVKKITLKQNNVDWISL